MEANLPLVRAGLKSRPAFVDDHIAVVARAHCSTYSSASDAPEHVDAIGSDPQKPWELPDAVSGSTVASRRPHEPIVAGPPERVDACVCRPYCCAGISPAV